jgi:hypothetical protein
MRGKGELDSERRREKKTTGGAEKESFLLTGEREREFLLVAFC